MNKENKEKIMLLYVEAGCSKPKMQGLATAAGSTYTIATFRKIVSRDGGYFYIVEAVDAKTARLYIADLKNGEPNKHHNKDIKYCDNNHTICIGKKAYPAIFNAEMARITHDTNVIAQGRVYTRQTRAIN